jgi:hypothetical protein
MQSHPYALPMQLETIHDIEAAKPAFLVLVYVDSSWTDSHDSDPTLATWLKEYSTKNYDWAGIAWILPDRTEFIFGPDVLKRNFDTSLRVAVLKRKPAVEAAAP